MDQLFDLIDKWLVDYGLTGPLIITAIMLFVGKRVLSTFLSVSKTPEEHDNTLIIDGVFLVQLRASSSVYRAVQFNDKANQIDVIFVSNSGLPSLISSQEVPKLDWPNEKIYKGKPVSGFVPFDIEKLKLHLIHSQLANNKTPTT